MGRHSHQVSDVSDTALFAFAGIVAAPVAAPTSADYVTDATTRPPPPASSSLKTPSLFSRRRLARNLQIYDALSQRQMRVANATAQTRAIIQNHHTLKMAVALKIETISLREVSHD
jgi:hypothetical protein